MTMSIIRVEILQPGPRADALLEQLARRLYRDGPLRVIDGAVTLSMTMPYEDAFRAVNTALDDGTSDWAMYARPIWAQN
jgi:hypothetical protein